MGQIPLPEGFLTEIQQQIAMLQSAVASLTEQNRQKDEEIERLNQILVNMQRARFGQSSEKRAYVLDDGTKQMSMLDHSEAEAAPEPDTHRPEQADNAEVRVAGHARKKKRTLEELCASLPVEEHVVDLPEGQRQNENGRPLVLIGQEYVRTELIMERAKAKVVKHYRKVYADRELENETGYGEIYKPTMPAPLLQHSYASASVATDVLVKKYADAMPLYRQEQMWKRMGVALRRGTMANWAIQIADIYLRPFWQRIQRELLSQAVIHADETVLQVLKEENRSATAESRMWVYASSKRADKQVRCFEYRDSRSGDCAKDFLKDFRGILVSDGYGGYNKVQNVIRAGCWAHARRKWHEAMPKGATVRNSKAAQGYEFCNRLFSMERELETLPVDERRIQRLEKGKPILDEYWAWLDMISQPSGKLKDAVTYSRNQKKYLCAFLEHGEIEISNNQVENAIRPFVVGRKGWLFSDTPQGAEASAIIYSLMETAKVNALNLEDYLLHLLTVLPDRFAAITDAPIDDLLPWSAEMRCAFALNTQDY
jgi:transposase